MDMEKLLAGDNSGFNPAGVPGEQRSFVRFAATLADGSYVVGFVEVKLGANKMKP
jgi:hypothetical protein